ncbi:MAG: N-acetylglucosamine-6-phosphate deacetylase [Candidatus Omnitrophica bacterium]|nr:N-acetylglucosamine-6-phosphate deacetylase [Candidatus Omnitrophota bacterium]MDD5437370.1 N-acetylglucosamine-6-phosphate deacetylase [Candidatus Omnitrophota bacterium]
MSHILIKNGTLIFPDALLPHSAVLVEGKKIAAVGKKMRHPKGTISIDALGAYISPGFIDTHIHGSPDDIFRNETRYGTTSVVIAESCAPLENIYGKIRRVEQFVKISAFGHNVLGVRLEGPYISRQKSGAQDRRYIKRPSRKETLEIIKKCGHLLKILTIAPEVKGAIPVIKLLRPHGIIASIGHSNATYEEAAAGIAAGISHATHIFNAMRGPERGESGASSAALLEDAVTAEIVLDLIHVTKEAFDILIKVKSTSRTILITDSVRAEKRPGVEKRDGVYKFKDGTIAGSALTTIGALRHSVRACGLQLVDAVRMLTVNPARLLGVERRKGRIAAGMDADITIFDEDFDVKATIVNGEIAYRKKGT